MSGYLRVLKAGPLCTIQDRGRRQCQHLGFSEGGAADHHALHWANKLLGNAGNCAALEITLGPFEAEFTQATRIAITGAADNITINKKPVYAWSSHRIKEGDKLAVKPFKSGLRGYLSIALGFSVPTVFGSCSTVIRETLGGFEGRPLAQNDQLPYPSFDTRIQRRNLMTPFYDQPDYNAPLTLTLMPGYQFYQFNADDISAMQSKIYTVSPHSDRMGYKLEGFSIRYGGPPILSEGIAYGSVQVPPNGQPIVLLNDRQTIGGYPKLGCIHYKDCYQLAQRRPGQKVRFAFHPSR